MHLKGLKTNFLGRNCIYYKKIDSTQNGIFRLIDKQNPINGTLIMTDIQTSGIGTHGRTWYTDKPNNIAFSFLLNVNCNIKKLDEITIQIAKLIVDIFKNKYNVQLQIKFPNDIMFKNKKVGGILTQTKMLGEKVSYLIVGIGINITKTSFNNEIKEIATSINNNFDIHINIKEFIVEFCNLFEKIIMKRIDN